VSGTLSRPILGSALCFPIRIAQPLGHGFSEAYGIHSLYGMGSAEEGLPDTVFPYLLRLAEV
jgi:hypothetical protein